MKIAFSSCLRTALDGNQDFWNEIDTHNPDVLILLGDNIYLDWYLGSLLQLNRLLGVKTFSNRLQHRYNRLWKVQNFNNVVLNKYQESGRLLVTWDDHDCVWNDIKGGNISERQQQKLAISKAEFLRRWYPNSTQKEIYRAFEFPEFNAKFIVLDNRSFAVKDESLLGQEQWDFFKQELQHSLKHTFICSSITLNDGNENWSNFPLDLELLKDALHGMEHVYFLSGDIHELKVNPAQDGLPMEIVSSGLLMKEPVLVGKVHNNFTLLEVNDSGLTIEQFDGNELRNQLKVPSETFISQVM